MATKSKCKTIICPSITVVVGVLLFSIGAAILLYLPTLVRQQVEKEIPLTKDAQSTKVWMNPPFDIFMDIWLFNFTNAEAFLNNGSVTPELAEVGPFRFKELQNRTADFLDDGTIRFKVRKQYIADVEWNLAHNISLDDEIIVLNVPLLMIYNMLANDNRLSGAVRDALVMALSGIEGKAFVKRKVRELLYEGYEDPILSLAHKFKPGSPARMGFFYGKNDTDDGEWAINNGAKDVGDVGRIISWKDQTKVNWWHTKQTNMINGTDGTLYAPFVTKSSKPATFVSDICRSIYLQYHSDQTIQGLPAFRFVVPAEVFAADDQHPANNGFCQHTTDNYFDGRLPNFTYDGVPGFCLPSGLLNISACQQDAPIVISSPHFLYASDYVQNSVSGMVPAFANSTEFQTVIDIEPITGAGIHFQRKLQINIAVAPKDGFNFSIFGRHFPVDSLTSKASPKIIPVLWINESAEIGADMAKQLYDQVYKPQVTARGLSYALFAVGLVLAAAGASFLIVNRIRQKRSAHRDADDKASIIPETPPETEENEWRSPETGYT